MAKFTFNLPDIGEGIAEAELVEWHVKVGDMVEEDDRLADVMTDKATVEMESPVAGTVVRLAGEPGDQVSIGSMLVEIETEGEGASAAPAPTVETVEAVSLLVSDLRDSTVETAATVEQQQSAVHLIEQGSHMVVTNARIADEAIGAIHISLDDLGRLAAETRQIGENVRSRAERLDHGFSQLVAQLRTA